MKRSQTLLAVLIMAAPFLAYAPYIQAAGAIDCVPHTGCSAEELKLPEEQWSCCKPPPCEFVQELKFAEALSASYSDKFLDLQAGAQDAERSWAETHGQQFLDLMREVSPCTPPTSRLRPVPLSAMDVKKCEIQPPVTDEGIPLEQIVKYDESEYCKELYDAELKRAQAEREICRVDRGRMDERNLSLRAFRLYEPWGVVAHELRQQYDQFKSLCSAAHDSKKAQQAAEDDLAPLIAEKKKGGKTKKKAKRSGKSGRR